MPRLGRSPQWGQVVSGVRWYGMGTEMGVVGGKHFTVGWVLPGVHKVWYHGTAGTRKLALISEFLYLGKP
jgi:hypothetical protein